MKIGKNEKKQLKLVEEWNAKHPAGIDVIVKKDDQTEQRTKTRSAAYMAPPGIILGILLS